MPYKSDAQRKKFHAMLKRGEIDAKTVHEYDEASRGKELPERVEDHCCERDNPARRARKRRKD